MRTFLLAALCAGAMLSIPKAQAQQSVSSEEAREIAQEAYIYAYPMILGDVTRNVMTNVAEATGLRAPMNQMSHTRAFPDASFTDVVRPNTDALYSMMYFDVSKEPMVFSVPDSSGRYYLLPMLDLWSDVFTAPGKRTTGTDAQNFAVVGPRWQGQLPPGMTEYRSPTAIVTLIGRTRTDGKADYPAVHKFQDGIKAWPLSAYGKPYTPPKATVNPNQDMGAPLEQVERMDAETFFSRFAELMKDNPPHANDYPILSRMQRIGLEPGKSFSFASAPEEVQDALNTAPAEALDKIKASVAKSGVLINGWRINLTAIGTYGTDYLHRAGIAYAGLGANPVEDAVHATVFTDASGAPFRSDRRYVLHFDKSRIPPSRAFWSLTMYNERQLFAANPIDRYAIGDRDKLSYNSDGSLDLHIQRQSPGKDKESNWLPTPASGAFMMSLRLYWPRTEVLDGTWKPPPVRRVD
ncbi:MULTISPECIES: DUF1254 domain-containing protein [unclassified Sinorhizobium]|uniref:DUF1254 domain-containing protein n=1 Tax=unclassified Sinorhizobium TaxID=2613772 RepID=UPI003523BA5A